MGLRQEIQLNFRITSGSIPYVVYFMEALEFEAVMFMICSRYRFMIGKENVAMTQK